MAIRVVVAILGSVEAKLYAPQHSRVYHYLYLLQGVGGRNPLTAQFAVAAAHAEQQGQPSRHAAVAQGEGIAHGSLRLVHITPEKLLRQPSSLSTPLSPGRGAVGEAVHITCIHRLPRFQHHAVETRGHLLLGQGYRIQRLSAIGMQYSVVAPHHGPLLVVPCAAVGRKVREEPRELNTVYGHLRVVIAAQHRRHITLRRGPPEPFHSHLHVALLPVAHPVGIAHPQGVQVVHLRFSL